jgi:hypothetical protein
MSLTDFPRDLPYPKLPFWDAVGLAYSSYFGNFVAVLRASWLWLVVVAGLTAFAGWQQWSWMASAMANLGPGLPPPELPKSSEMAVLLGLANILILLGGVSIAVAWHRLMILDEQPGLSGSNVVTKNLWRYIVMAIALFLTLFLPMIAIMLPTFYFLLPASGGRTSLPPGFLVPFLFFVAYLVGIAIMLRLTLLLPARAIGNTDLTFRETWNRTRGNTWRLFWGMVVTTIPPVLIAEIGFLLIFGVPGPANFASGDFVTRMTTSSAVFTAYYLLIVPIGIGFLSHAYRHFFLAPIELTE